MTNTLKLSRIFISFTIVLALIIGMFSVTSTKVIAKENIQNNAEIINPVYNEHGELIEFTVVSDDLDPALVDQLYAEVESRNINLMTTPMNENGVVSLSSVTTSGVFSFVSGACFILEVLSGYSCAKVARFIGLKLIDGYWMWNNKKYTGKWKVTRGYIPGCEPRHSEGCFKTTYTKIG